MKNDLSSVKVGDYIWTIYHGWTPIVKVTPGVTYPITTEGRYLYTLNGKHDIDAKYPSAFIEPPAEFNAGTKPSKFKNGDKVLVKDGNSDSDPCATSVLWQRRYFSHEANGFFYCYRDGLDEWASMGILDRWDCCKHWKEGEDE